MYVSLCGHPNSIPAACVLAALPRVTLSGTNQEVSIRG